MLRSHLTPQNPEIKGLAALILFLANSLPAPPTASAEPSQSAGSLQLEETLVTAVLRASHADQQSVSLFGRETIRARGGQHLEDLLSAAPNVNASSGASRSRFVQIRGIGERSQFIEPVNASVALLIDGVDLTGLASAATLWDVRQVEILRGPQGTLMGANALAGLITVRTTAADDRQELSLSAGVENYGGYHLGVAAGTSVSTSTSLRFAVKHYASDGFIDNVWLNRDDTNQREELNARLSGAWTQGQHRVDATYYYIDVDNGYDGFSLDNSRDTLSDQPGRDALTTHAGRLLWQREADITATVQASVASTDTVYSYDEDWAYVGIAPGWEYSSFDEYQRDRDMQSIEARLEGDNAIGSWVTGVYWRREAESLARQYTYLTSPFGSELDIDTAAVFGQIDTALADRLSGYMGGRLEERRSDYADSASVSDHFSDTLWSGRAGIEWQPTDEHRLHIGVSRGVRGGGVNANLLASVEANAVDDVPTWRQFYRFDAEALTSFELGWHWRSADNRLNSQLTLFAMSRDEQQVKQSLTVPRTDGSTAFIEYTDNAATGHNRGVEWQAEWLPTPTLKLGATLGLLRADYQRYVTATGEDLSGRAQPQAPNTMGSLTLAWLPTSGLTAGLEVTYMDDFFFSDRHDTRAVKRELVNGHIDWRQGSWRLSLWGRNLLNDDYTVRGFGSFGNDPRKEYVVEPYYQFGEPRVFGLTLTYDS